MTSPEIINRDARRDYTLEESLEAGIVLKGAEVKSIRLGKANWSGGYAAVEKNGVMLHGLHIDPYKYDTTRAGGGGEIYNPTQPRCLLIKKKELLRLKAATQAEGMTLVPLRLYWKKALIKIELGLGKGKKKYDKRAEMKEKLVDREKERLFRYK